MLQVTVYGAEWCAFCKATKEYLTKKGIPFTYIDIEKDMAARAMIIAKANTTSIPIIEIGDEVIIGFDRKKIDAAVRK